MTQLRGYQTDLKGEIYGAWNSGARNVLAVLPTGGGKCLAKGTPVLMYDGAVRAVEDIAPGDFIMGPDSAPRGVVSVCSGRERMYRVTPTKGAAYEVNESHILSFVITGRDAVRTANGGAYRPGDVVNLSVLDFLACSKTFRHAAKGYRVAVNFAPRGAALPIPPYVLGAWLGDGTEKAASLSSVDPEVIGAWAEWGRDLGCYVRAEMAEGQTCPTFHLSAGRRGPGGNPVLNALRAVGVLGDRRIPRAYLTASRDCRLALLAGVIDTDGYLHHGGYDLVAKRERFAQDVAFLARSLGFACYVAPCRKKCYNTGAVGDYFRLSISGDLSVLPVKVPRRKAPPRAQKKDPLRFGVQIEPIGEGEYFGFELCGTDRRFLLGDFTVTHNTTVFGSILRDWTTPAVAIAHRQELVGQIAFSLAREGVRHRIIAPENVIRNVVAVQMIEYGRSYYDPNAAVAVAGVDTIIRRPADAWTRSVGLWVIDEGHHILKANKWGSAADLFPNAYGLAVTATPCRADGRGLGRHADGIIDAMVEGPSMRWLIEHGFLTDYRIFAPPSDVDLARVRVSEASGDFNPAELRTAVHKSHIVGDVVEHYLRAARGKLGVTFAVDVEAAAEQAAAYNAAGVPAEMVTAKTPDTVRAAILRRFRNRELLQLVNVDLFGEGFDLPALEVVSMARPTMSLSLHMQQFGRSLRPMEGKGRAIILDHVGNVMRHGLPDAPRVWTLDARERRGSSKGPSTIPIRSCPSCTAAYERIYPACPFCGFAPEPAGRSTPQEVDGDLGEFSPEVLEAMRGAVARVDGAAKIPQGLSGPAGRAVYNNHLERQQAQARLRDAIALWGGWRTAEGDDLRTMQRRFFHTFGVDTMTAQALSVKDAEELTGRVLTTPSIAGSLTT